MEHLKELRTRLIRAFIALFITTAISFVLPAGVRHSLAPLGEGTVQALRPTESLGNYMKVALLCGIILAMPLLSTKSADSWRRAHQE